MEGDVFIVKTQKAPQKPQKWALRRFKAKSASQQHVWYTSYSWKKKAKSIDREIWDFAFTARFERNAVLYIYAFYVSITSVKSKQKPRGNCKHKRSQTAQTRLLSSYI